MTQPELTQQALFPDLPREKNLVDPKTGNINPIWDLYFQQQNQNIQTILSNQGFLIPNQTTTNISTINSGLGMSVVGIIVYDSILNVYKGIIPDPLDPPDGTKVVTFTTS